MAADNAEPDRTRSSGPDAHAEQSEEGGPPERYGPLALTRHRKDDDRALILYTVEEPRP
jgi:hypothetical protein